MVVAPIESVRQIGPSHSNPTLTLCPQCKAISFKIGVPSKHPEMLRVCSRKCAEKADLAYVKALLGQ